jgi:hypothetical protein
LAATISDTAKDAEKAHARRRIGRMLEQEGLVRSPAR